MRKITRYGAMKGAILLALALWLTLSVGAQAAVYTVDSGVCGEGLTWTLNSEGLLTISGTGPMDFYYGGEGSANRGAWFASGYPIYELVIESGVTYIGNYAFRDCDTLRTATIPGTVTAIYDWAFANDTALTGVYMEEGVSRISRCAFNGCASLPSIFIPKSVTAIGESDFDIEGVFEGCSALTAINVSASNANYSSVDGVLFNKSRTILYLYPRGRSAERYAVPDGVEEINTEAFNSNPYLEGVTLPDTVKTVGSYAFAHCTGLKSIALPDSVTSLYDSVFWDCVALEEATLPNYVKSVPFRCFRDCKKLKYLSIPGNAKYIGDYAFCNCSSLEQVVIPVTVGKVESWAFYGCSSLKSVQYMGTQDSWNQIEIGSRNDSLTNASLRIQALKDCAIHFDANGGSGAPADEVRSQQTRMLLPADRPSREGHTFAGWAASPSATRAEYQPEAEYLVSADATLYAVWESLTYTVRYDANGGTGAPAAQEKEHDVALTLSSTRPKRTGYGFQGWTSASGGTVEYQPGDVYRLNQDATLYAVWKADKYTVRYDANGGTGAPDPQEKEHDVALTLSSTRPKRTGYGFQGWASASGGAVEYQPGGVYKLNQDATLYAVWKADKYTVRYDANGGTGAPAAQEKAHDVALTLSKDAPSRAGYTFMGWAATSAGSALWQPGDNYEVNGDATLYAVWQEEIKNTFDVERDAYSFINSMAGFGYTSKGPGRSYPMPYTPSFTMIFENNMESKQLYSSMYQYKEWEGNCAGMSSTVALMCAGGDVTSENFGKASVGALDISDSNGSFTVLTFIEAMQFAQSTPLFSKVINAHMVLTSALDAGSTALDSLYAAVKQGASRNEPVLIGIGLSNLAGHALLAYGVEEVSSTESRLLIYDCNAPGEECAIPIYRNAQGRAVGWRYDMGRYGEWGTQSSLRGSSFISYVDCDTLKSIWDHRAGKNSGYGLMIVDSDDFSILDIDGNEVASLNNGKLATNRSDIFELVDLSLSESDNHALYLPRDYYTLLPKGTGTLSACFSDQDLSADVTTSADAVSFLVDARYGFNSVFIENAGTGDSYSVTLSSSASGVKYENVVVSGTGQGTSLCISGDNDTLSLSNCNIASLSINGVEQVSYVVSAIAGANGRIEPAGDVQVPVDGDITFTITPDAGYCVDEILLDGLHYGSERQVTLKNVLRSHTLSVSFRKAYQLIDAVYDRSSGTIQVDLLNENRATLVCAVYDASGRMLSVSTQSVAADCGTAAIAFSGREVPAGGRVRIMLASSGWEPLCACYDLPF